MGRGVSKIRLVDFDYVTLSSLNRHACAGSNDVGTPKVACIERNLKNISRWVDVDARVERQKTARETLSKVGKTQSSNGDLRSSAQHRFIAF